jgi:hypothetical protein
MKKIIFFLIIDIIITIGCSSTNNEIVKSDLNQFLPEQVTGFARTGEIKIYSADSLHSYLGDADDEYLRYGVVQAASCEYGRDNTIYAVDLFEFSNLLGAFGIYGRKRLPDDRFISLGSESLIGNGYIYYYKNRYFMTINSLGNDLPDWQSLNNFAATIDSLIPGIGRYPEQLALFPDKRLIAHSEKFWPRGFDNYEVPESCFSADYQRNGETSRLFYAVDRPIIEYETFKKLIQRRGRILTHMAGIGKNSIYAITDDESKILLGYSDGIIYGVLDVANDYWAKALCEALFENMGKKL